MPRDPSDNDMSKPFIPDKRTLRKHSKGSEGRSSSRYSRDGYEDRRVSSRREKEHEPLEDEESYNGRSSYSVQSGEYDDFIGQSPDIRSEVSTITGDDEESQRFKGVSYDRRADNTREKGWMGHHIGNGGRKESPDLCRGNDGGNKNHVTDRYESNGMAAYHTKPAKRGKNKWFSKNGTNGSMSFAHRRTFDHEPDHYNSSGVKYRSASSTLRALEELKRKRLEAREKKRAVGILAMLVMVAAAVHLMGRDGVMGLVTGGGGGAKTVGDSVAVEKIYGKMNGEDNARIGAANPEPQQFGAASGNLAIPPMLDGSPNNAAAMPLDSQGVPLTDGAAPDAGSFEDFPLPPPKEKTYGDSLQFLAPLRHFADVRDISRPTDTSFFFHVPRAGGSTVKDMVGKCLGLVQSSEVGVRDGHGEDPILQVLTVQENKYVNVDTTTINGIQRAVDMGLARSGMSDVIVSSYFHESAALFDLEHQGRAFVMLRNPIERAVSMYYHRLHEVHDLDESVTIEDYAQGNGIENNWMTRFLTNRMTGELTKEDLEQAKEILKEKFLIGFLDDLEESTYRIIKYNGWKYAQDETAKMKQEDCINDMIQVGSNINADGYEIPKRGTQAYALIVWQTQFDTKLYEFAKTLFDAQTKTWGTKERKKQLKKEKQKKKGG